MYWVVLIFHVVIMPVAAFHALVYKRDHRAALGWIGIIIVFPIAGAVIYFLFGINRLRSRARLFTGKHLPFMSFGFERAAAVPEQDRDTDLESIAKFPLSEAGLRVTGLALTPGNRVDMFVNGEQWFPHLIDNIRNAKDYVLVSSYLFSLSGIGGDVVHELSEAATRGIRVHVLIDGVGAWYSFRRVVKPLRKAGVKVALFLPPSIIPPSMAINLRNHRKIAVVDGIIGYFGGINIDQRHMVEDADNPTPTEDIHFCLEGPAVDQLQLVFATDWLRITGDALELNPPTNVEGGIWCRILDDGPDDSLDYLTMTLLGAFSAAQQEIVIMVPYFLPSREMIAAIQAATIRGVRVRVILPERSNLRIVDWACRNMLWELLIWHVEIYFKQEPFAHSKLIVIDDYYVLGGSANLDARSLRLNFELGVEMFNDDLCRQVRGYIDKAQSNSRRLDLSELDNRPMWKRARDAFFWLFSSYL